MILCISETLLPEIACLPALDQTEWPKSETLAWHETYTGLDAEFVPPHNGSPHSKACRVIYDEVYHGSPDSAEMMR